MSCHTISKRGPSPLTHAARDLCRPPKAPRNRRVGRTILAPEGQEGAKMAPRVPWRQSTFFLKGFVFGTGAAVMAVEFSAQRLLEPFFGSSQLVWATLIGLILLALSLGYAWGGRLADRRPDTAVLGSIVLGAGIFVALLPFFARPFLTSMVGGLLGTPAGVILSSMVGVVILFVPPVVALGAVSPFAVRLLVDDARTAGSRAGSLYAWSTFGSLFGTFVPAFLTIPDLGVRTTLYLSATLLVILGGLLTGRRWLLTTALLPLLVSRLDPALLKPVPGLMAEVETAYQFAQVYHLASGDIALSVNDSAGIQSLYTPARLTGLYYDAYLTLPFLFPKRRPVSTLLIGMAAGTIPTLYARDVDPFRAPVPMTGVEIDPELVALGRKYFHLKSSSANVKTMDGRVFLETTQSHYDLLIVDAYSQEIYIPFPLTTETFFALCREHLNPDGILAMNVNATSLRAPLLLAIERTLGKVFPHVVVARAPGAYNYLLMASQKPIPAPGGNGTPTFLQAVAEALSASWKGAKPGPGLILTDNRAPVEALTDEMILERLRSSF